MPPKRKPATVPTAAVALVRISDDPDGRAVGVGRQEEDCRALADRLGWTIAEVIVENDTSAFSTRRTNDSDGLPVRVTKRPEFRRALKQLHSGRNDGLVVYDIDRLARQPRDLEALIDLAEVRDTPVVAVTGSLDVSNSAGRAMARVLMAMANKSSEDTGRRVARAARQRAESGAAKRDGFRPYGYDRDMAIIPDEGAVVREVAERIIVGDSVRSITVDLNRRRIPTARGGNWWASAVKSIVTKPTVAGLRAYQGEIVADGTWEPILDRDTWTRVRLVLGFYYSMGGDTERSMRSASRYLLSGIAVCGVCGSRLYASTGGKTSAKAYRCIMAGCGKVSRNVPLLDEYVTAAVEALLRRDELHAARRRRGSRSRRADLEVEALHARRREIVDSAGLFTPADLAAMLRAVDDRILAAESAAVGGHGGLVMPSAAEFRSLPVERRRAVTAALVTVTILPSTRRGPGLDVESVRVEPAY